MPHAALRCLRSVLCALACALLPASVLAFNSRVDNVSVQPGGSVVASMTFTGDGTTYENLDYLSFDNAAFSVGALTSQGRIQCSLINVGGRNYVRAFAALGSGNPIDSGACIIQFIASPNAAPGVYPLLFVIDASLQPQSYCQPNSANCFVTDGSITVLGSTPPPTIAFVAT
ncbi:MAG TPA: hypothetical protein VFO79_09860, partial [Xanthomonadales bacterium]|nr:hypothetical protein [Xanthomonadales bacterium]